MTAQVAADLLAAADVLERDGWTQEQYHGDNGCHCVQGALAVVIDKRRWATPDLLRRSEDDGLSRRWDNANGALRQVIGRFNTADWNDEPERTAAEVIAALRAAADAAEADQ